MSPVTLIDGTTVDSASEAWRHECEARHVARLPSRQHRQDYLDRLSHKSPARAAALKATVIQIFNARRQPAGAEA